MEKKIVFKTISIVIFLILIIGCSKVPKFDHYGVYIKDNNGYKEIKGYEWSGMYDIYSNSRNFDKTQILFENEIEIYVYSPKAKLTEYKLIKPIKKSRKGDFISANFGFGRKSPEAEITIEPIENKDDMVKIRSKTDGGTLILHIKEESKGYVFNSKNNANLNKKSNENEKKIKQTLSASHNKKYKKEIKKTISNWISLINKSKYKEFVEDFKTPAMVEYSKNNGEFEDIIDDFLPHKSDFITELKQLLQEEPIINIDFVSFKNSNMKLCKINGKWYQYIAYEKSTSKPVEKIK